MPAFAALKLSVIHHPFRPGGVRRVIELAAPWLAGALRPRVDQIVLAGGEAPDPAWRRTFRRLLDPVPVVERIHPALGYVSELGPGLMPNLTEALRVFLPDLLRESPQQPSLVWAHNLGLGRNLLLARELAVACEAHQSRLVFHHHDWWFDNRWQRWREMHRQGIRTLSSVAAAILPAGPGVRHVAINQADAAILRRHFPGRAAWLPNPASQAPPSSVRRINHARRWLRGQVGGAGPVWLMPCRLLRRKNIAEALLLTRWLRPEAWLVTTAGVSSPDEQPYADRLRAASERQGWRLRLSVLTHGERGRPAVADLLAASEVILLTSLQEGVGLSYVEAAVERRPLIARMLPNVAPDLQEWGLRFPQSYDEVWVPTALFDWRGEVARQQRLFRVWRSELPSELRRAAERPVILSSAKQPEAVPFSRLTLSAQLEVLAQPVSLSWSAAVLVNPWLRGWREAASCGALPLTRWPSRATRCLGGAAFARGFTRLLKDRSLPAISGDAGVAAQREFISGKLRSTNLYPLTWSPQT